MRWSAGRAWATEAMVQARVASLGSATLTPVAAPVPVLNVRSSLLAMRTPQTVALDGRVSLVRSPTPSKPLAPMAVAAVTTAMMATRAMARRSE